MTPYSVQRKRRAVCKDARLNPGVVLAFCWAHQRSDFLDLANSYPESAEWALRWVDTAASDAQAPIKQPVHEIGRITLEVVSGSRRRIWLDAQKLKWSSFDELNA